MSKENNVIRYYVLCNKLKNIVRTGWKDWNIKRNRIESVAEHIYGSQMLAIAMQSEYEYDINLMKVITMLAVHELEEIIIGDISIWDKRYENKGEIANNAVEKILNNMLNKNQIEAIISEFNERKTPEALFAYHCDKLECDLQAKLYDEEGCINLEEQQNNDRYNSETIQNLIKNGSSSFTELWFHYDKSFYENDNNFMEVFEYAKNNKINIDDKENL